VATGLRRPLQLSWSNVRRRARRDDLDPIVVEELVLGRVLPRVDPVLLQKPRRFSRRVVVDAGDLGERMVAKRLDILARHPAGAENGHAVLFRHAVSPKTVASLCSLGCAVNRRGRRHPLLEFIDEEGAWLTTGNRGAIRSPRPTGPTTGSRSDGPRCRWASPAVSPSSIPRARPLCARGSRR